MALLRDRARLGWRDIVLLLVVAGIAFLAIRGQLESNASARQHRQGVALLAVAVCQQADVLVAASLAHKTAAERAALEPLVTQYLDPLNRALVALGFPPSCKAPPN